MSSVVNPLFYRIFVSAKGFYSTVACTGCGKCAGQCPLNNIVVEDGKPRYYNTGYRGMNG